MADSRMIYHLSLLTISSRVFLMNKHAYYKSPENNPEKHSNLNHSISFFERTVREERVRSITTVILEY